MDYQLSFGVLLTLALISCIGADPEVAKATTTAVPPTDPTTSSPPNTTTAVPTPPPTTTSPAPPTPPPTTTPAPTPAPTPVPDPTKGGNWTVSGTNVTCIVVQMMAAIEVEYPLDEVNKTSKVKVYVPSTAESTGSCDSDAQYLKLTWGQNFMQMDFAKNDTTKLYFVKHITTSLIVDNKTFPNASSDWLGSNLVVESSTPLFKTSLSQSYRCIREEDLKLTLKQNSTGSAVLALSKVQLQAFQTKPDAVFATASDCELDTPDIVPIAVGCALAALVFVVLVAYLVGRRRSQARGYLSM